MLTKKPAKNTTLLFVSILFCVTLFSCNNSTGNDLNIPEGEYVLTGDRGLASMECGMSETTFGKSLIINNGKMQTSPLKGLETVNYSIKKIGDNYLTSVYRPLAQDSISIQFSFDATNNQLIFLCENTQIIYAKK